MGRYVYDGPVLYFDRCINFDWHAETVAPSESKARSNLAYRYKKEHGYLQNSSISLPGKIVEV